MNCSISSCSFGAGNLPLQKINLRYSIRSRYLLSYFFRFLAFLHRLYFIFKICNSTIQSIHPLKSFDIEFCPGNTIRSRKIPIKRLMKIDPPLCTVIYLVGGCFIFVDFSLRKSNAIPQGSFVNLVPGNNKISGIFVIRIVEIGKKFLPVTDFFPAIRFYKDTFIIFCTVRNGIRTHRNIRIMPV